MRLLLDACLSPGWVIFLTNNGIDATHWTAFGTCSSPDIDIFRFAQDNDLVLFTHDLDFGTLLALEKAGRPSVVQARVQDITPAAIGTAILTLLRQFSAELEAGAIITLLPNKTKVRILPI